MRIRSLSVQSVRPFEQCQLDFGGAPALHILYGPNEAGKSTLLRLLIALLYGGRMDEVLKGLSDRTFYLGGVLEGAKAPSLSIQRKRKRSQLVLADENAEELLEDDLAPYLGGYDRERFHLLFGFDHDRLRQGGKSLLESGGHAGVSLFEAGGGIQRLQNALASLSGKAQNLLDPNFNPRSVKLLNKAYKAYKQAEAALRSEGLRGEDWHRLKNEIEGLKRDVAALLEQKAQQERQTVKLQRILRVRAKVAELKEVRQQRGGLGDVAVFSDALEDWLESRIQDLNSALASISQQKQDLDRLQRELQGIRVESNVLACAADISRLTEGVEQYVHLRDTDLVQLRLQAAQRRSDVELYLQELAPKADLSQVEQLRIPFSERDKVERVSEEVKRARAELSARKRQYAAEVLDLRRIEEQIQQIGEFPDETRLRNAVGEVRQEGDLAGALRQQRALVERERQGILTLMQRQTLWRGDLNALPILPVPLRETVDSYHEQWKAAEQAIREAKAAILQNEEQITSFSQQIEELRLGGEVPLEEDLTTARQHREAGWELVKQSWLHNAADREALAVFAGEKSLAEAYEQAVEQADAVADLMRRESERSAKLAQLLLQRRQSEETLARWEETLSNRNRAFDELTKAWRQEWEASGISPRSPAEMKEWLGDILRPMVDGVKRMAEQEAEAIRIGRRMAAFAGRLSEALSALAASGPQFGLQLGSQLGRQPGRNSAGGDLTHVEVSAAMEEGASEGVEASSGETVSSGNGSSIKDAFGANSDLDADLQALLQTAQRWLDELDSRRRAKENWEHQLSEVERKVERSDVLVREAEGTLMAAEAKWQELLAQYVHLPPDPESAARYLQKLDRLFQVVAEVKRLTGELLQKKSLCEKFEESVKQLRTQLDERGSQAASSYESFVRLAQARLGAAQKDQFHLEQVQQALKNANDNLLHLQSEAARFESDLNEYLVKYSCAHMDDLRELVERSKEAKNLEALHRRLERDLRDSGDGLDVGQLEKEVSEVVDQDALHPQIEELQNKGKDLEQTILEQQRRLWEMQQNFAGMDGNDDQAAHRAQEAEFHLADVDKLWNEYLRIELAKQLLERSIEEFRQQNESSVLDAASGLFEKLTLNRYRELTVEYDGHNPVLEAVLNDGKRRRVEQMSDGTRDQLFLALRLAFVSQHLSTSEPLPLMMDDILINFDDARSQAALEVLSDLGTKTQILYFTHHQSIVDAALALKARRVQVHTV